MSFEQQLIEMDAHQEVIDWVEDRTLEQAWNDCNRGDWMLWLLEKMEGKEGWLDEKEIMVLGCWCARRTLKYVPEEETRPLKAIEAKEAWTRGEITREEMVLASDAAWAAAKTDALDASFAAANDAALAAANDVAYVIANDAAYAASWGTADDTAWTSINVVAWIDAWNKELSIQANYIRAQFTPPKGELCLLNNS
jgi:hypothetical protein